MCTYCLPCLSLDQYSLSRALYPSVQLNFMKVKPRLSSGLDNGHIPHHKTGYYAPVNLKTISG